MKYDREMKIICKLSSTEKNDFHSSVGILTDNLSSAFFLISLLPLPLLSYTAQRKSSS